MSHFAPAYPKKVDCRNCIERIEAEAESNTEAQKAAESR